MQAAPAEHAAHTYFSLVNTLLSYAVKNCICLPAHSTAELQGRISKSLENLFII